MVLNPHFHRAYGAGINIDTVSMSDTVPLRSLIIPPIKAYAPPLRLAHSEQARRLRASEDVSGLEGGTVNLPTDSWGSGKGKGFLEREREGGEEGGGEREGEREREREIAFVCMKR